MTKRETAQKIISQGDCIGLMCDMCPLSDGTNFSCGVYPRGATTPHEWGKMVEMAKAWLVKDDARIAKELAFSTLVRSIPMSSFACLGKNMCSGRFRCDTPNVYNVLPITWESLYTPYEHHFSKELFGVPWDSTKSVPDSISSEVWGKTNTGINYVKHDDMLDSLFTGLSGHAGYDPQHTIWWNMFKADAEIRRNEMSERLYDFKMHGEGNGLSQDKIVKTTKDYPYACEKCEATIRKGTYALTVQETYSNINCKVYKSYTHRLCASCTAEALKAQEDKAYNTAKREKEYAYAQGMADWVKAHNVKIGTHIVIKDKNEINKLASSRCFIPTQKVLEDGLHGSVQELGTNYIVVSIEMFGCTRSVQYDILTVIDDEKVKQEKKKAEALLTACENLATCLQDFVKTM